jgi:transposase-like protein
VLASAHQLKLCYLWRAVDHEGEVVEAVISVKRGKAARDESAKPDDYL